MRYEVGDMRFLSMYRAELNRVNLVEKGQQKEIKAIEKKEFCFICLSGLATGVSWLCYYRALQEGPASVVVPIDKLSMLVMIAFSWIVFQERLTKKAAAGVLLITAGTVLMAIV